MSLDEMKAKASRCVSHHDACDCREYYFEKVKTDLRDKVERLQAALARIRDIAEDANHDANPDPEDENPQDWTEWAFGMILREIDHAGWEDGNDLHR